MPGTFQQHCSQSYVYSDQTTWRGNAISESNFQNVPRCLGPQEPVPLVQVAKPPTVHYQPAT